MNRNATIRLDFLSAALRHRADAEHLADPSHANTSLDQAYHLAGFGPECARKAVLSKGTFDRAIGHSVGDAAALGAALALDPGAHRYRITEWGKRYPLLAKWTEQARYEETGTRASAEVAAIVREAAAVVDAIALALWADGRVPAEFKW